MNKLPVWAAVAVLFAPWVARATQPLTNDDTVVQGAAHWQLELGVQQAVRQGEASLQRAWGATLTYGLNDQTDVYVNAPYVQGSASGSGWGDTELGIKWRFAQYGPVSFALKPRLTLSTGDQRRGLGAGRAGTGATLIVQWETGRFTLLGNAGGIYQPNDQGQRQSLWQASGAALYRATETLQLALDAVISRNPDAYSKRHPAYLIAGAIYSPRSWLDLDMGYRHGLNSHAGPDAVMAGLTLRW
jgi:hypothetical protein